MTEAAGAARAVAAILRHAAAERDGLVSVRTDGDELVVASPGETSLLWRGCRSRATVWTAASRLPPATRQRTPARCP